MQPNVWGDPHCDILELCTRLFLNSLEDFERPLRCKKDARLQAEYEAKLKKKKKTQSKKHKTKKQQIDNNKVKKSNPIWIDKNNFLSLLNLPDVTRHTLGL
jgi:DNA primase catalytic subunit